MSNSCGAGVWLINALKGPREVEHNKQMEGGGKKKKGKDWRESVNECVHARQCARPRGRNLMLPFGGCCIKWFDSQKGVHFPHQWKCSCFSSLGQSCSLILDDQSTSSRTAEREQMERCPESERKRVKKGIVYKDEATRSLCSFLFLGWVAANDMGECLLPAWSLNTFFVTSSS